MNFKVTKFPGDILYVENAIPASKDFLNAIEQEESEIIPNWQTWYNGYTSKDKNDEWVFKEELEKPDNVYGILKTIDWDLSINKRNSIWPRINVDSDYDEEHKKAYEIIKIFDQPYVRLLEFWANRLNHKPFNYISKNYCIRQYVAGSWMGEHIDRNYKDPRNSMDWTVLVYLNDDYEGGELVFPDYNITIKPSAGSAIFFPCNAKHSVNKIQSGKKTFVFLFIHTHTNMSTSLGEPYNGLDYHILKQGLISNG